MPVRRIESRAGGTATQRLWVAKAAARAPRIAVLAMCGIVAFAAATALLSPKAVERAEPRPRADVDLGAQAFAEAFARAYLTWDSEAPEAHERAVARFIARDVEPAAGLRVPSSGSQRVHWTATAADRKGGRRRIVTVTAETDRGLVHLAVPVSRDARGLLFVSAVPAVVGAPARTTAAAAPPEAEVEDRALLAVATRVVRNYLGGERDDLAADLDPEAVVSLPELPMEVRSTEAVTWASEPRRVAVAVTAEARDEARLSLRYELGVLRVGGRWVVRTIHTNPVALEGDR